MSRRSEEEYADALQLWLGFTLVVTERPSEFDIAELPLKCWLMLAHLAMQPHGRDSMAKLREGFDVSENTLTRLVNELEGAGYLTRVPQREDHRSMDLQLTKEGYGALGKAIHAARSVRLISHHRS